MSARRFIGMPIDHLADVGTGLQTQVEFRRAGHVEPAAGPDGSAHQVRMGIGLDRIVHRAGTEGVRDDRVLLHRTADVERQIRRRPGETSRPDPPTG